MEILPVRCGADCITSRLMGVRQIRPQTVAEGYDCRCYRYVKGKR